MAKIKFGMIVTDGRGKLGGQVFSKNRAGAYIRTKVTPVNPQTSFQTAVRASFGAFSQEWSGLSAALITAWNNAVNDWATTDIFGDLKRPSGKNLFLRLNQQATQAGYTAFTAVPGKAEMVNAPISAAVVAIGAATITLTGISVDTTFRAMISLTPPLSGGTSFVKNRLRLVYEAECGSVVPADIYTAYVARFGAPTEGANVHVGIRYVLASGQASPVQQLKSSVTA